MIIGRREFLQSTVAAGTGLMLSGSLLAEDDTPQPPFKISLAQWSLHRSIFGKKMDHLEFASVAKEKCGIEAIEYVNQFFYDKAQDADYLAEMNKRAEDAGVKQLLIMVDNEGALGDPAEEKRIEAVKRHHKWVEAAKALGCHTVRVNASSSGSYDEQKKLAADGLRRLSEFAQDFEINIVVENHGGLSSNGKWLAEVIKTVDLPNCGTLPDFGNFTIDRARNEHYDRYQGVDELMPFAKAVSAKSHNFDDEGNETSTDFFKMMDIVVKKHGYNGYVGVEYEGGGLEEIEGILATKRLLQRCAEKLA